jgi:hypothetical protein
VKRPLSGGEWYKDEEADCPKHQASQDATSSDPKEAKNENRECNTATSVPDSSTVHDTEQELTFKRPRTFSSSDKEPKNGDVETDSTSNNPEETKNECSEYNSSTGISDSLTVRDTEQKLAFKEPRTSSRQKKPPTTKNNDFLW